MLSLNTVVVASSLFALSTAFERISVPANIAADTDFKLTILNDLQGGVEDSPSHGSFDAQFSTFSVYLAIAPPGQATGPACHLAKSNPINTTSLTLQIPSSVGPSDEDAYSLALIEYKATTTDSPSGLQYTNTFVFTHGHQHWSAYETSGNIVGDPENLPCTAYECARNCTMAFYPGNAANITNDMSDADFSAAKASWKSTYDCEAACPGATYAAWDDDGDDDSSSTTAGSASTTVSSAPAHTHSTTATTASSPSGQTGSANSASSTPSSTSSSASAPTTSSSSSNVNSAALGWVFVGALAQLAWR